MKGGRGRPSAKTPSCQSQPGRTSAQPPQGHRRLPRGFTVTQLWVCHSAAVGVTDPPGPWPAGLLGASAAVPVPLPPQPLAATAQVPAATSSPTSSPWSHAERRSGVGLLARGSVPVLLRASGVLLLVMGQYPLSLSPLFVSPAVRLVVSSRVVQGFGVSVSGSGYRGWDCWVPRGVHVCPVRSCHQLSEVAVPGCTGPAEVTAATRTVASAAPARVWKQRLQPPAAPCTPLHPASDSGPAFCSSSRTCCPLSVWREPLP